MLNLVKINYLIVAQEPTTTAPVTTPDNQGENRTELGYTSSYANIEPGNNNSMHGGSYKLNIMVI